MNADQMSARNRVWFQRTVTFQEQCAIDVPAHFRFIDRSALEGLDGNDAPSAETLGWLVHESGKDSGYQAGFGRGYTEAKDEKAAAAWANTPEGKLAYRFAQTGSIASLAKCDKPGWYIEKGVCYVKQTSEGIYGWGLP